MISNFFFLFRSIKIEKNFHSHIRAQIELINNDMDGMKTLLHYTLADLDFTRGHGAEYMYEIGGLLGQLKYNYISYYNYYLKNIRKDSNDKISANYRVISGIFFIYSGVIKDYCNKSDFSNDSKLEILLAEMKEFVTMLEEKDIGTLIDSDKDVIKKFNNNYNNSEELRKFIDSSEFLQPYSFSMLRLD